MSTQDVKTTNSAAVATSLAGERQERQTVYPDPNSIQNAPILTRMRAHKFTWRKLLAWATAVGLLIFAEPMRSTFVLGSIIVFLGLVLRIWAFGHLRKNLLLVVTGPYAHTRNPAYVGSGLVMTGLFVAAGNPFDLQGLCVWGAGLVALFVFFVSYMPRKYRHEYNNLRRLFGDEPVDRHAANVPDFSPRLRPWQSGDTQKFSWRCVLANHELVWPFAGLTALLIVACDLTDFLQ